MWKHFLKQTKANFLPYDILNLGFVVFLLGITIFFYPLLPDALYLTILYLFCLIMIVVCANKNQVAHYFYPILLIFLIFQSMGYIIPHIHHSYRDPLLYQFDVLLFGSCPFNYLQKWIRPWLTEILQLGYISYYFMPVVLGMALFLRKDSRFPSVIFAILLGFYVSYIGYLLFPAVGPRFYLHFDKSVYENTYLAGWTAHLLNILEKNKTDAFPSGHTQISIMCTYFAHYLGRNWSLIYGIMTALLIVSTVYCHYHYITDVIAGILLAIICLTISPGLEKRIGKWLKSHGC